mmetsp:Transcript_4740/g.4917  ORF Transcript_4740/g.4917 Transcript_4740/m.4917 type:complete len:279 (+) Transcript_4740:31-867(+)
MYEGYLNDDVEDEMPSFKVLTIGESGVGKTSVLLRFTENKFMPTFLSTIGIDYKSKILKYEDTKYVLKIWDTAGQERFKTITQQYYKGSNGIILVFDLSDDTTFYKLQDWIKQIREYISSVSIILLGNKSDLFDLKPKEEKVENGQSKKSETTEEATKKEESKNTLYSFDTNEIKVPVDSKEVQEFAEKNDLKYFEVSALKSQGIEDAFNYLLKHMVYENSHVKKRKHKEKVKPNNTWTKGTEKKGFSLKKLFTKDEKIKLSKIKSLNEETKHCCYTN